MTKYLFAGPKEDYERFKSNIKIKPSFEISCLLTPVCNLKCEYCCNAILMNTAKNQKYYEKITINNLRLLVNKVDHLTISGGEPFLSPILLDVIELYKEKTLSILSNFTAKNFNIVLKEIFKINPKSIEFVASYHPNQRIEKQFILNLEFFKQLCDKYKDLDQKLIIKIFTNLEDINIIKSIKEIGLEKNIREYVIRGYNKVKFNDKDNNGYSISDRNYILVDSNGNIKECDANTFIKQNFLGNYCNGVNYFMRGAEFQDFCSGKILSINGVMKSKSYRVCPYTNCLKPICFQDFTKTYKPI